MASKKRRSGKGRGPRQGISGDDDSGPVREAFLDWYAARHEDVPRDAADAVDLILDKWGPRARPGEPPE